MIFARRIKSRLVYRLIIGILLFSGLITLVITSVQLYIEYRRDMREVDVQFEQIEKSFLSSLTSAVWFFNMDLVESQLEGMHQLRDIVYLEVTDHEKRLASFGTPGIEDGMTMAFPLRHVYNDQERVTGTLKVTASLDGVYQRLYDRVVLVLISSGTKTLLVSFFILLLIQYLVTRHLQRIAAFLKDVDITREPARIELKRRKHSFDAKDELDQVVAAVNRLLSVAGNAYHEASARIRERTEQLETVNRALKKEISDRIATEAALEKTLKELERSNTELEQFAYIASHDLQEPLRKITVFIDRVMANEQEHLGDRSRDYMKRVMSAADRMKALIDDLLAYSRITTRAKELTPGDLSKVVSGVLQDLEMQIDNAGAEVRVDPLPRIRMDPLQMKQLFQNLISNAVKFRRAEETPVIAIRHETEGDWHVIRVRDNGIGFDEKYLDRIFKPFQRLHGRLEYEGSGMGLAICEKVMHRHGGTITAESHPEKGSTFVLEFPCDPENKEEHAS